MPPRSKGNKDAAPVAGELQKADDVAKETVESVPAGEGDIATGKDEAGDDQETQFDKRLNRLAGIAEDAEFESGTLVGDIRDFLIEQQKNRPNPWSAMSQDQQRDFARNAEAVAKVILRKLVLVIAQEDSDTVEGTLLGQFTVKGDTIEAKLKIESAGSEEMLDVYRLAGHKIVIVSADDSRFRGQRKDPAIMPDQPGLEFADGKGAAAPSEIVSDPPAHPDDDSDLAGEVVERQRTNLQTGMIERVRDNFDMSTVALGDAIPDEAWEDERDATTEELAAERERIADFEPSE